MEKGQVAPPLDSLPEPEIPMGAPLGQSQFVPTPPPQKPVEPAGPPAPAPEYVYKFDD